MWKLFVALIVSIAFLLSLSVVDSATGIGETILLQPSAQSIYNECLSLASQFGGQFIQDRCATLEQVNRLRATAGVRQLRPHPYLMRTAQWWAEVQAYHREGGHPEAVNQQYLKYYKDPVRRSGLFCNNNQNSAQVPTSLGRLGRVYKWTSSGHNANQLDRRWHFFGAGLAVGKCPPSLSNADCYYPTVDFSG